MYAGPYHPLQPAFFSVLTEYGIQATRSGPDVGSAEAIEDLLTQAGFTAIEVPAMFNTCRRLTQVTSAIATVIGVVLVCCCTFMLSMCAVTAVLQTDFYIYTAGHRRSWTCSRGGRHT